MLELFTENSAGPGNTVSRDVRPSSDPANPSGYRVDLDPVDVPLLVEQAATEGVLRGFEAYSYDASGTGYIALTEVTLGTHPASTLPLSQPPLQVFAPTPSGAGNLSVTTAESVVLSSTLSMATLQPVTDSGFCAYAEGRLGVTFDTSGVDSRAVPIVTREFGLAGSARPRRAGQAVSRPLSRHFDPAGLQAAAALSQGPLAALQLHAESRRG